MNKNTKWIIGAIVVVLVIWLGYSMSGTKEPAETGPVTIGVILPLTGPAAFVGEELQNGFFLASQEINESGEKIKLYIEDSASNPKDGVSAFNKLENAIKPDVYISTLSSVSMALAPLAEQNQVALLGIVATVPDLTRQNEYTFRYYPTAKNEVPLIVKILRENNITKTGVVYLNDDFGSSVVQELKDRLNNADEKVITESFLISENDFRSQITKIKSRGAEAVLAVGFDSHIKNIYTRAKELKFEGKLIGLSTLSMPHLREQLGSLINGAFVVAPKIYDPQFVPSQKFMKDYKNKYGKIASHYSANGYDALKLMAGILQNKNKIKRIDVINYLSSLNSYKGVFGSLEIDKKNREISFPLFPARIENGILQYLQ